MQQPEPNWADLSTGAVKHLKQLLTLDTTNPPGNEHLVAEYVADELRRIGLEPKVVTKSKGRDNVVARLPGDGSKKPILLASHSDVVPAIDSEWTHPPFGGVEVDGCLWGRGAVDMKCGTAMHLALVEAFVVREVQLCRDIIIAVVADEETGMECGSRFLVNEHPNLVKAEYALGEVGGFSTMIMGRKIIPIQVAEKGFCWLRATARGESGHGSLPNRESAIIKLGQAITKIGKKRLPIHVTDTTRAYLKALGAALPLMGKTAMTLLQDEKTAGPVLDVVLRKLEIQRPLMAMLSNTATPTVVSAGDKFNVIPDFAEMLIDGRTLPGQGPGDLVRELKMIAPELDFDVIQAASSTQTSQETELFSKMTEALLRHSPDATVVPMLLPGMTDAQSWSRLGTQCYGFIPLPLPEDFPPFFSLYHGHDERVPISSLEEGTRIFYEVLVETCCAE